MSRMTLSFYAVSSRRVTHGGGDDTVHRRAALPVLRQNVSEPPRRPPLSRERARRIQKNREITALGGAQEALAMWSAQSSEFDDVNHVTVLHRIAKSSSRFGGQVRRGDLQRLLDVVRSLLNQPLHIASTAWSVSVLPVWDCPLIDALSATASATLFEFSTQSISNLAWSYAKLLVRDRPLFEAIAHAAITKLS